MQKTKADNRARLLQAAEKTTYRYGFGNTAIADIAKEARIPLGNVYYYFKTKDEIGEAIVEQFRALGKGAESRGFAVHLLSATQGVSVLAHTFHDPGLIDMEAARLKEWIRELETENT